MREINETTLIPLLRFPEFVDSIEWEVKTLGTIGFFIGGGTPDTNIPEYWNGHIQWFTPTEVKDGVIARSLRTITEVGLRNSSAKLLPRGTILITTRATIGDIAIIQEECATNQGFQSLIVNSDECNQFWYYWILKNKRALIRKSSGSTFPEIGKAEIAKIKVSGPKMSEQQKIADCLSSLDDLISAETQRLELLKTHKKGLLQNLFPGEGETVPKFRFPEFKKEDWRKVEINKLGETVNGLGGKSGSDFGSGKPYITYKQVFYSTKIDFANCGYVKILEEENQNSIHRGDILITTSSETPNEVGYASVVLVEPQEPTYLNSFCFSLRPFNLQELYPEFSQYLFQSPAYRDSIIILAQGSTRFNISKSSFLKLKVPVPINPTEQQKIADCLSSLDDLINLQAQKIKSLKMHKKGLMQGLFPDITE